MVEIKWPMDGNAVTDSVVFDWLEALENRYPDMIVYDLYEYNILHFTKEEDAIAFKLKFGIW